MTDQELIERVAVELMGWHIGDDWDYTAWLDSDDHPKMDYHDWNPLTNDANMDMVLARVAALGAKFLMGFSRFRDDLYTNCDVVLNQRMYGFPSSEQDGVWSMLALKRAILQAALAALEATSDV